MSEVTPNPEQLRAIEHTGGVLLEAGAGSGKTFVLVEHVIFLLKEFYKNNNHLEESELKKELQTYLSKNVLMTFTKKASGEMAMRLSKRLEGIKFSNEDEQTYWKIAKQLIHSMYVGTIHGFCIKLIKEKYFPNIPDKFDIVSEVHIHKKINFLINQWFSSAEYKKEGFIGEMLLHNKKDIVSAFFEVFSDPQKRISWSENVEDSKKSFEEIFRELIGEIGLNLRLAFANCDFSSFESGKKSKWYEKILYFRNLDFNKDDYEFHREVSDILAKVGTIRGPAKGKYPSLDTILLQFSLLKDFNKKYFAHIEEFKNNQTVFLKWELALKSIFDYVEQRYIVEPGFSFSDIEYYLLKSFDESNLSAIRKNYKYFIIDEYQDTSEIQFKILSKLIDDDFSRMFCIGDKKQAIYGFRGGEINVFTKTENLIPQTLFLKNNYRSLGKIINFNNYVFDDLFSKGINYEGIDPNSVKVEYQTVPDHIDEDSGSLNELSLEIDQTDEEKVSSNYYHFLEAQALALSIKERIQECSEDTIAILYKSLKPSKLLIKELIELNISFTAQVKIPLTQDPMISILLVLLEDYLTEDKDKMQFSVVVINQILNYFGSSKTIDNEVVFSFYEQLEVIGIMDAFNSLVFNVGFSNSNSENNFQLIEDICKSQNFKIESIYMVLQRYRDKDYSFDFQTGDNPQRIRIMSTHASKGLEFDHVFLGGLKSNGLINNTNKNFFGSEVGSFKWKSDLSQKKFMYTPMYILESLRNKKKDFSESKRLFYVANTRAIKSLSWPNLDLNFRLNKTSWFAGLESLVTDCRLDGNEKESFSNLFNMINKKSYKCLSDISVELAQNVSIETELPMFHKSNLGLELEEHTSKLGLVSQISVTSLSQLTLCPYKFYLSNICKLSKDDLSLFTSIEGANFDVYEESLIDDEEIEVKSSASRGSYIHEMLSHAIKNNFVLPREFFESQDAKGANWVLDILRLKADDFNFQSEEELKFTFFGQMVSGIPDLVLKPLFEENIFEIWDFKTGRKSQVSNPAHIFQLKAYAYASYITGEAPQNARIKGILAYLDAQSLEEFEFNFTTIKKELFEDWKKITRLGHKNLEHCGQCQFNSVCQ